MAMLSTDQSMHPPPSSLDEMEYDEVINLMKYLNMKITRDGESNMLLLNNYLYAERRIGSYEDKMQDTVNKIMKKYVAEKNRLLDSYLEIEQMARTDAFKKEVAPILEERFPKYMEQLQERINKLTTDEIEICIIGWTCAGKSTFFNILLGVDIMPTNVLPDTPCLIRLHNSQTRKIQYEDEGKKLTVRLTEDPQDAKRQLKAMFDQRGGNDQTTLDVLDLYWPIPGIHENVVFVDTPGIGEKDSLTQLVMKHVPNAAGYICIINSGEGGGILEGGIVQLFEAIADRECETENKLRNVLFICNKWDMIKRQDRQAVSEDTRKKLKRYFGFAEDWQIIHFSASVEVQLIQLRASPTKDFLKILEGLERLVSRTVEKLFFDFIGWIKNVIGKSMAIIDKKMSLLSLSNAELVELTTKTATILEETQLKLKSSKKIETMVDTKKSEIIQDLQEYLKTSQIQKRAVDWKLTDLKTNPSEIVMERIHMLISEWAEKDEGVLKKAIADVEKEFIHFVTDIEKCLSSILKMERDCCPESTVDGNIKVLIHMGFGLQELSAMQIIVAGMTRLAGSNKISIVAVCLTCAIAGLILIKKFQLSKLTILTLETLEKVSDDAGNIIRTLFELPFKRKIKQFRSTMQCEISSQQKLVQELSADVIYTTDLQSTLFSLSHELKKCLMHLEKRCGILEYNSDDDSV